VTAKALLLPLTALTALLVASCATMTTGSNTNTAGARDLPVTEESPRDASQRERAGEEPAAGETVASSPPDEAETGKPTPGPAPTEPEAKQPAPEQAEPEAEEAEPEAEHPAPEEAEPEAEHPAPEEAEPEAEHPASEEAEPAAPDDEPPAPIVLDTEYDDARVGEEQTSLIEAEMGLVKDPELERYVRSVALRLLRHAPTRPFEYEFQIVDQSVPNAFALPGGKIYLSRGLLALVTSEDELAGVLGHEITHAAERHAAAQMEYNRRLNPFTIGLLRAARIAAYGRDQERDADRGGQILAARAGYDPSAIAEFLRKLDASERYEVGWSRLPSFFATHPTSPERAALALERANQLEWKPTPGVAADRPDGYYDMIDGLILGDDPAGGLFDAENRFSHPELRFTIRFPQGWMTMNSQQAVRAVSPDRDAQAELTLAGSADRPLDDIVDDFLESDFEGLKIRVRERRKIKLGDRPAIRVEGRAASPIGSLTISMTFVRHEALVYRLTMLSASGSNPRYRGRARAFAHSFRPLDDEGARSLRVTRLRVARALESETLQELSLRTRNELELVFTGILNGIYASTPLARREAVKIGIAEPYLPQPLEGAAAEDTQPATSEANLEIVDAPPNAEPKSTTGSTQTEDHEGP